MGLLPVTAVAQARHRYSGKVERIDLETGMLVVSELAAKGRLVFHEVRVDPETPIVSSRRLRPWEMRGRSAYGEQRVSLVDLVPDDFVIVVSTEEAGREVAQRVTIVEKPTEDPALPRGSP